MSSKIRRRSARGRRGEAPSERTGAATLDEITQRLMAHRSDFRAFLRRRLPDDAVADDVLQHSVVRAVERYRDLRSGDNAVRWFYRILRHAVADHYRAQTADDRKVKGFRQGLVAAGEDKAPALDEVRPTVCACLAPLLRALRPSYAEVLQRIDLQGEAVPAVAQEWGLTPNNLTVRLHRARQALKARLEEACGVCTKHGCLNCTCEEPPGNGRRE